MWSARGKAQVSHMQGTTLASVLTLAPIFREFLAHIILVEFILFEQIGNQTKTGEVNHKAVDDR